MAGAGDNSTASIRPWRWVQNRALYVGAYGGFMTLKDLPRVWCPIVARR